MGEVYFCVPSINGLLRGEWYLFMVYNTGIGISQWALISISWISANNVGNIDSFSGGYHSFNIVLGTFKPNAILSIHIRVGQYKNYGIAIWILFLLRYLPPLVSWITPSSGSTLETKTSSHAKISLLIASLFYHGW